MDSKNDKQCDCAGCRGRDVIKGVIDTIAAGESPQRTEERLAAAFKEAGIKCTVEVIDMGAKPSPLDDLLREIVRGGRNIGPNATADAIPEANDELGRINRRIEDAKEKERGLRASLNATAIHLEGQRKRLDDMDAEVRRTVARIERLNKEAAAAAENAWIATDQWKAWEKETNNSRTALSKLRAELENVKGLQGLVHGVEELLRGRGLGPAQGSVAASPFGGTTISGSGSGTIGMQRPVEPTNTTNGPGPAASNGYNGLSNRP